jgi:YedE family putative selenium metabolism protein
VAISLAAGLALGIAAQRSRLCMAGAFRDLMLIGSRLLLWGAVMVVLAALVGNLIAGHIKLGFAHQPVAHSHHLWNALGMMLVGLAAVMAGGCPLRQLVLAGTGNSDSTLTVLGMVTAAPLSHNLDLVGGATVQAKAAVLIGLAVALVVGMSNREPY